MCGSWPGTLVTWPWLRLSMIYSVLLWDIGLRYPSRVGVGFSRFRSSCLVVSGKDASVSGMAASLRDGYGAFRQPRFECGCCEMLFFRVCGVRLNVYVCSLYRNPDLDDRNFDCLLASKVAVRAEDVRASFLFVGDLNGNHQEWLGSTTTNSRGVAAFDFATVSGCDQFVVGPTHARGVTHDLLMTDVLDLVRVAVVAPMGNSDHSSLSAVITMAQAVPNMCVRRKVFLKQQLFICNFARLPTTLLIYLKPNHMQAATF